MALSAFMTARTQWYSCPGWLLCLAGTLRAFGCSEWMALSFQMAAPDTWHSSVVLAAQSSWNYRPARLLARHGTLAWLWMLTVNGTLLFKWLLKCSGTIVSTGCSIGTILSAFVTARTFWCFSHSLAARGLWHSPFGWLL